MTFTQLTDFKTVPNAKQCVLNWALAGFVILAWGVTFASTRVLLRDFSALEIQLLRFAIAWCGLRICESVLERGVRAAVRLPWRGEIVFAAMGLTGVAIYQFLENCAIYYTNASNVAVLVSFGPIVTAVLAWLITGERALTLRLLTGSLVAVCGVALVSLNGIVNFEMRPLGDFMAIGAMVSWGLYSVLVDKVNKMGVSPLVAIRKTFFWAMAIMTPFALWGVTDAGFYAMDGSFSVNLDADVNLERFARPVNLVNIIFLGGVASAACFVMWNCACRTLGVVRTTLGLYLTPIVGVAFASLFLGERLTVMSIIGGVSILVGVAIANMDFTRRGK